MARTMVNVRYPFNMFKSWQKESESVNLSQGN